MLCPLDFSNSNIAFHIFFASFEVNVKYLLEPLQPRTFVAIFWWLIVLAILVEDNGRCLVLSEGHCHADISAMYVNHPGFTGGVGSHSRMTICFDMPYKRKIALELRFCYYTHGYFTQF